MALQLKNNLYFKINSDGTYYIYKNKAARNKEKKATSANVIIEKYKEIINNLYDPEYLYYADEAAQKIIAWETEFGQYRNDLQKFVVGHSYPLMEQYYPDVAKSIPEVVSTGKLGWAIRCKSLKEIYTRIKELNIFIDSPEPKDI